MNRRQKIIVSVTGIFIVLLALLGLTFAYFLTQIRGNDKTSSISVTTANLVLEYGDGNNIIKMSNVMPGDPIPVKTFTVTNKGNATVNNYKVYLESVQNQLELKDDLTYTLTCKSYKTTDTTVNFSTLTENGTCTGAESTTFPSVMSLIATNIIDEGYTHYYELQLSYPNAKHDQSVDMNKLVQAKVNLYDEKTKFLATEIMDNAKKVGTFDYNKTEYIEPSLQNGIKYSKPAQEINKQDERILTYTFDNYGTSYYYRGNVEDNYVTFSNKCWRIVRIEGDGSIKLTLESQNQCSENMTSDFSIGTTNFGYKTVRYNDIGDYKNSTSGMKNKLTTWLNETIEVEGVENKKNITLNSEKLLKIEEWCLGNVTNVYSYMSPYGLLGTTAEENYESDTPFYFETGINIYGNGVTHNATLICNGEKDLSKIGTLTVDEVVLAGARITLSNYDYYLQNDNYAWDTLSISHFNGANDSMFYVNRNGSISSGAVYDKAHVRPAVSLSQNVLIVKGDGTQTNPYVVN